MAVGESVRRKRLKRSAEYAERFGLRGLALLASILSARREVTLAVPDYRAALVLRPRTGDEPTFDAVIVREEYGLPFDLPDEPFIIDAGANVGYTAAFFAEKYPSATIYAIEPESANYGLLVRNTGAYERVVPVRGALWYESGHVEIVDENASSSAFRVGSSDSTGTVPAYTVSDIISMAGRTRVNLLKIDIEGAEKELFESGQTDWLDHVDAMVIELHDWFKPGCAAAFYGAIGKRSFRQYQSRENIIIELTDRPRNFPDPAFE
jgi:FkbM family methyltransferase